MKHDSATGASRPLRTPTDEAYRRAAIARKMDPEAVVVDPQPLIIRDDNEDGETIRGAAVEAWIWVDEIDALAFEEVIEP